MSLIHPSPRIAKFFSAATGTDDGAMTRDIVVPASNYGVLYKLLVSCDVASEADLENLNAIVTVTVLFGGSTYWKATIHPFVEHISATPSTHRHVDLGPWSFEWGADGIYSLAKGEDIAITLVGPGGTDCFGTGIKGIIAYTRAAL